MISERLPESEYTFLTTLRRLGDRVEMKKVIELSKLNQSQIMAAAVKFSDEGMITIEEKETLELSLSREGENLAKGKFPERTAIELINQSGGSVTFQQLPSLLKMKDTRNVIKWLIKKKWCIREGSNLRLTSNGKDALSNLGYDEKIVSFLYEHGPSRIEEIEGIPEDEVMKFLSERKDAVKTKKRVLRRLTLTPKGLKFVEKAQPLKEVTELTSEHLTTGKWREVAIKRYDVKIPVSLVYAGKTHPFRKIIDEARKAFLELGFKEIASPYVESTFWDFDALFQPQDHPAREMQDTFYVKRPDKAKLPSEKWMKEVKRAHENGGGTGSTGWGYRWSKEESERVVLRTHTTATTVRWLAHHPNPPQKVFAIGKVFRREKTTFKHLPEFCNCDGIIIDEKATLANLIGTLSEFYSKLGLKELKFRPSFFPYTEPSVEVFGRLKERENWIELGGAGIFRPEVTLPFGCKVPVLAWGLGLDRLAMIRYKLDDIRKLYFCDINWLKEVPLCL